MSKESANDWKQRRTVQNRRKQNRLKSYLSQEESGWVGLRIFFFLAPPPPSAPCLHQPSLLCSLAWISPTRTSSAPEKSPSFLQISSPFLPFPLFFLASPVLSLPQQVTACFLPSTALLYPSQPPISRLRKKEKKQRNSPLLRSLTGGSTISYVIYNLNRLEFRFNMLKRGYR